MLCTEPASPGKSRFVFLQGLLLDFFFCFHVLFDTPHLGSGKLEVTSLINATFPMVDPHWEVTWARFNVAYCSPTPGKAHLNAGLFPILHFPLPPIIKTELKTKSFFMSRTIWVWKVATGSIQIHRSQSKISKWFRLQLVQLLH